MDRRGALCSADTDGQLVVIARGDGHPQSNRSISELPATLPIRAYDLEHCASEAGAIADERRAGRSEIRDAGQHRGCDNFADERAESRRRKASA